MSSRISAVLLSLFVLAGGLAAQSVLKPADPGPTIDGKLGQGEYPWTLSQNGILVFAALSADGATLSLAIQAPTSGWVAMGLGASLMNGAYMVMAYDAGGKPAVSEQLGSGHSHSPVSGSKVLKSSVRSADGSTVLEFQVKAADFVKGGRLPLIVAYGKTPDFVSRHVRYGMMTISVGQ